MYLKFIKFPDFEEPFRLFNYRSEIVCSSFISQLIKSNLSIEEIFFRVELISTFRLHFEDECQSKPSLLELIDEYVNSCSSDLYSVYLRILNNGEKICLELDLDELAQLKDEIQ